MLNLTYDLHIHSCLSPCGDDDMTPANIVGMAALKGLDLIAVTDHNSCKNCPAVLTLAEAYGITALPGMELTTEEEVHVVCLFADLQDAMAFDEYVYSHLIPFPNNEKIFGKQQVMDVDENVIATIPNLLINATDISFDDVYALAHSYHGIMIPAHIDKNANSLLAILGFIPPDSRFTCAEIHDMHTYHELKKQHPYLEHCHIISNSDAHYLEHINEPNYTLPVRSRHPKDILTALTSRS
jgi:hypothetical protein